MSSARSLLRSWLPPALDPLARQLFGTVRFVGNFASWEDAARACGDGYAKPEILERVERAALAVKRGEAAFERDSVLFEEREYEWPVLGCLLWVAAQRDARLRVLDFGGSLGSSYYQHRPFLSRLRQLRWSIVEQPHFVERGVRSFQDETLRFFHGVEEALEFERPDVLLLSGVLQVLQKPYEFLDGVRRWAVPFVIVDRMPFHLDEGDRLCALRVTDRIYPAAFPHWFLRRERFLAALAPSYRVVEEWPAKDRASVPSEYRGFLFERSE